MDGGPCNSSHSMGKDLLKQPMKIKIIGSSLCKNETEEPMRGDCQKFWPIRSENFSPWVSFWKDDDLRSLANFSFHLSPETVKQFVILIKMINKHSFFLFLSFFLVSENKEEKTISLITLELIFVQSRRKNMRKLM
jgi:hypothetical protein